MEKLSALYHDVQSIASFRVKMIVREVNLQAGLLPFRQSLPWADSGCETNYRRKSLVYFKGRAKPPAILRTYARYFQKHLWNGCILVVSVILFRTDDPISNIVLV